MIMAERVGFEPTAPCGVTGFQDQLLKPLGHLSIMVYYSRCPQDIASLIITKYRIRFCPLLPFGIVQKYGSEY